MPLILGNDDEAPKVREHWYKEYHAIAVENELTPQDVVSARFARLVTDNVRALACTHNELIEIQELIHNAMREDTDVSHDWQTNPVETARLNLLHLYIQNLRRWRSVATLALRQWRFAGDHDVRDPYFELPKDGWQERSNIERALNELDSCTDRLPAGWGRGSLGQEGGEVEVVFEEGVAQVQDGAGAGEPAGAVVPGLVDYSDTESDTDTRGDTESGSDTESEDDFVLTVNGQPTYNGRPIGDVFPGGEAEDEETASEEESESGDGLPDLTIDIDTDTDSDDSDGLVDLMARNSAELPLPRGPLPDPEREFRHAMDTLMEDMADVVAEWEAANRETTGEFIEGRFVERAE